MPRPYSGDLRRRVVAAALDEGQSRGSVARRFAVGRSTVYRWVEAAREEGRLEAKPMRGGPRADDQGRERGRPQAAGHGRQPPDPGRVS